MPYKHWVGGSNPSATTRYSTGHGFSVARFFFRQRFFRDLPARRTCLFSADVVLGSCQISARFFRFRASFLPRNGAYSGTYCQVFARIFGKAG